MIKARLSNGMIVLGLTADNIRLLTTGKPIVLALSQVGGVDDIVIMYGETIGKVTQDLEILIGEEITDDIKNKPNHFEH